MRKCDEQDATKLEAYLKFYAEYFSHKNCAGQKTEKKETLKLPASTRHKTK